MARNASNTEEVQLRSRLQLGKGQVEVLNADRDLAFISHPYNSPELNFFFV